MINKKLEMDFAQLFDKISVMRTKSFELSQAASAGKEELADALFKDVQTLLTNTKALISDIHRWKDEIKTYGQKQGYEDS